MAVIREAHTLGAQAERLAGRRERAGGVGGTRSVALVIGWYLGAAAIGAATGLALGRNPLVCAGTLGARGVASWLLSLGVGLPLGAGTIAASRSFVRSSPWAHALHVATASALGEELFFRGLLVPLVGVVASSALFGAVHQIGGRARWGWMAWAAIMGALFAIVFKVTGSLIGPLVAHAAINCSNLRFLRDNDPAPAPRRLGGLLRR
jgi:membrane protease YdiL (CAAX protease family)